MSNYTDFAIVCGLTPTGLTHGAPDSLQFGIPVRGGELWEFSFFMSHKPGAPDAQVIGSWITFDLDGVSQGVYSDDISYAPQGYLLDTPPSSDNPWVEYKMQHVIATGTDGLTTDPSGGVCGYIMPAIWWHSTTTAKLGARYVMGVMLSHIVGVGGAIAPLTPDVFLTLGVPEKLIAGPKSFMGPS